MTLQDNSALPLISVVIPCYNHARYLGHAIESVLGQDYSQKEIIVVDDGSTDETRQVTEKYSGVKYIFQENAGLSAARNTGIRQAKGEMLLFLDADDWLYPKALTINSRCLIENPKLAFVSGGHNKVDDHGNIISDEDIEINKEHYLWLLQMNYIGMHATVLYRRWVFNEHLFDTTLKACEDYDLYLKISRKYPVMHHCHKIAAYRWHENNMSGNIPKMLTHVLLVLNGQKKYLRNKLERQAMRKGKQIWKTYYAVQLFKKSKNIALSKTETTLLLQHKPLIYLRCRLKQFLIKLQ